MLLLRRVRPSFPRWINPSTGNDANDGKTAQTAWATVAPANTALAVAGNGITHLRIDTSGSPLYLTASLVIHANAKGITVEGATPGTKADIRAYKVLSNASFTQPDSGTYPNVWSTTDTQATAVLWEKGGSAGEDLIWYTHKRGANFAAVASNLNNTAGSFWTDGTTLYFRPLTGNDPVGDGKEYVRSRFFTGNDNPAAGGDALKMFGQGIVRNLKIGGTTLANATTGAPDDGYVLRTSPAAGTTTIKDCYLYAGSKHVVGAINGATNSTLIFDTVQAEQASCFGDAGAQTVWVSYSDAASHLTHIYRNW